MALLTLACLSLATVSGHTESETAYPIEPVPLRLLCERADVIALVQVQEVHVVFPDGEDEGWPEYYAELLVQESFLGTAKGSTLKVPFEGGMICPAPAFYEKGLEELVFLVATEDGSWRTVGLSYGTIYGEKEKMKAYLDAVRFWPGLREWETPSEKRDATLAWILELAADPYTRWEGACELLPLGLWDDTATWPFRGAELAPSQIDKLIGAWTRHPTFSYDDEILFELLADVEDPRIDAWLWEYLQTWFEHKPYGYGDLLQEAVRRWGSDEAKAYFEEHWRIDPNPKDDSIIHAGWGRDEEKHLHHILRLLQAK